MATYQKAVKKQELSDFDVLANLDSDVDDNNPDGSSPLKRSQVLFSLDTPRNLTRRELHPSIKFGFYLDGVLTREECDYLIKETNDKYSSWLSDGSGETAEKEADQQQRLKFRKCDTIEVQNPRLRDFLFEIIASGMTPEEKDCVVDESDVERFQRDLKGRWVARSTVKSILFSRYLHGGECAHAFMHAFFLNADDERRRNETKNN